jgi:hypothetical protein
MKGTDLLQCKCDAESLAVALGENVILQLLLHFDLERVSEQKVVGTEGCFLC